MKSSSLVAVPGASTGAPRLRRKGLWAGAVAIALLGAVLASGVSWASIVTFAPYLLILACPAMHLLMCRSHKRDTDKADTPSQ